MQANTTTEDISLLTEMMSEIKEAKLYKLYLVVTLFLKSFSVVDIMDISGLPKSTIYDYIKMYKTGGLGALEFKHPPGRPPYLTPEQESEIKQTVVEKTPAELGYPAKFNWTLKLIRDYIEREYKVKMSINCASMLMKKLGLSYTKATYTLASADKKNRIFS